MTGVGREGIKRTLESLVKFRMVERSEKRNEKCKQMRYYKLTE